MRQKIQIKWFENISEFDALKTRYKELVKKYHPDLNPENSDYMKEINAEYDFLLENLSNANDKEINQDLEVKFKDIILELTKLDIDIEICGSWLWLHGDTRAVKEKLKELQCRFSGKKKLWYWHDPDQKRIRKSNFTMQEIRAKYGSSFIGKSKKLLRA